MEQFKMNEVKLGDKYFRSRRELVKQYIKEFDINRLMHTLRKNAGIESTAVPLGGWEAEDCSLRGHFVGHFLSACSQFAFSDGDDELKEKANVIVDIFEECAKPNGYLSAFEENVMDTLELEEDRNVWAPYYTLHKILQGLVDAYEFIGNEKALKLVENLANYIYNRFSKLSYWKIDNILRPVRLNPKNEFGGIGDVLYSIYEINKDEKILELAKLFDREYFTGNLEKGLDLLDNLHANTHLPMITAAMHRYNITKEERFKTAVENFYEFLLGRTFANGSSSSKASLFIEGRCSQKAEHWGKYSDLTDKLTGGESESCCSHNTEKIAEDFFKWTNDIKYLDHIEILKYNSVLNSASSKTGLSQYHQPMGTGAKKIFSTLYETFWCCTGSGIEAMSEVQKNIYFKDKDSLLINLFVESKVNWIEKNMTITQHTDYPNSLKASFTITAERPKFCKFIFKEHNVKKISINDKSVEIIKKDGFIIIEYTFNNNDIINVEIEAKLHLVPLLGCDGVVAIMYGPILLAELGSEEYIGEINNENINLVLSKTNDEELTFSVINNSSIKFIPLFRVEDEKYTVYINNKKIRNIKRNFSKAEDGSGAYVIQS
ncbi:hypothetical protein CLPUN_04080 [Clostridium puniceum]|uniref:Non-reducing end beta-L-arabinofuranosidase n=1 Tax=Clostridium puniceum TaxID=29367 RepID=A0A1S8TXF7_9CLOT|nr:beta-L-arabinofuranosidase domain-containing protein [Clostridium puniceum]OOM82269.1 hypothetical protein CLPUN_04080 [Clostridium puniceum]